MSEKGEKTVREALLNEMYIQMIDIDDRLKSWEQELSMRTGITQDIIDKHLNEGVKALDKYTNAANAHFTMLKKELQLEAQSEIKKQITESLIDAHHQINKDKSKNNWKFGITICLLSVLLTLTALLFINTLSH